MRIQLIRENAKMPTRANPTDAGIDLYAPESVFIDENFTVKTGVCIELPKGTVGLVFARSGLATKFGIRPRNCVGVIDEKYRGEIMVTLENPNNYAYSILEGDRIAQLVVVPVIIPDLEQVKELDMEGDRKGGYGSTGR